MKSRYRLFAAILLCAANLAVGAAPPPLERAKRELQVGGELYMLIDPSALRRHVSETCISLERNIAESSMPNRDRAQAALALLRAATRFVGLPEIAALGVSSIRENESGFSNRMVIAAEPGSSGWLWRIHGSAEPRLARIAAFPADTALALDFGVDLRPVLEDLDKIGGGERFARQLLPVLRPKELLESLSGNWQIALAIPDGWEWNCNNPPLEELQKCDIYVSMPDNRGRLQKMLEFFRTLNPSIRQIENVIFVPLEGNTVMVFVTLENRMLFFSSVRSFDKFRNGSANLSANGKFVPGDKKSEKADGVKTLGDDPGFAAALKRLPGNSHGAYFTRGDTLDRSVMLDDKNGFEVTLPHTANRSVGVWRTDDRMIVYREISTSGLTVQTFDLLLGASLRLITDSVFGQTETSAPQTPSGQKNVDRDRPAREDQKAASRTEARNRCVNRLRKIQTFIADYAKRNNGKLPPELPKEFTCGASGYLYFAPFAAPPSGKMPLVADQVRKCAHPGTVNVLFVDGSIQSFEFDAGSAKRLCSYLYTIYRYDEKEFIRLIERASQLDAGKGK